MLEIRVREVESGRTIIKGTAPAIGVVVLEEGGNLQLVGGLPPAVAALALEMIREAWIVPALDVKRGAPSSEPKIVIPRMMPPPGVGPGNDGKGG